MTTPHTPWPPAAGSGTAQHPVIKHTTLLQQNVWLFAPTRINKHYKQLHVPSGRFWGQMSLHRTKQKTWVSRTFWIWRDCTNLRYKGLKTWVSSVCTCFPICLSLCSVITGNWGASWWDVSECGVPCERVGYGWIRLLDVATPPSLLQAATFKPMDVTTCVVAFVSSWIHF